MGTVDDDRKREREQMVREQIEARGVRGERLLQALREVPRHRFLPPGSEAARHAYEDRALPIRARQTISQPYIVARMTELLELNGDEKVLEVGAGSGYQTAILSRLCREVVAVERLPELAAAARRVLEELGVENVRLVTGDGSEGWPADAPYDAALAAAVAPAVPPALLRQLRPGGRLVMPVGAENGPQKLLRVHVSAEGGAATVEEFGEVAFVPMVGASGFGFPADLGDLDV